MADFLVLEEDGTSHLELEESTDDLILEDGTLTAQSSLQVAVGIVTGAAPAPPSFSTWKVGTITVPSSPGTVTVSGLGGRPDAVFFYGTNWLTEDTAVTTTGTAIFRGMCAPQWDNQATLLQNAATVSPAGDQSAIADSAILCHSTAGSATVLYAGSVTAFGSDGFTVDFATGASGGYKVVYVALMTVSNVGAYRGLSNTISLGWKAGACLLHGAYTNSSVPVDSRTDMTMEFYGGASYPGTTGSWYGAGLTAFCFPTSNSQQYIAGIYNDLPSILICQDGSFVGPFLSPQNVTAVPTGTGLTNFAINTNLTIDPAFAVMWDDSDGQTGRLTPGGTTGNTSTVSGLPFAPGLVIGYSISDEPQARGTGGRGAVGFSVVTPDFQWAALIDGVSDRGSFQSFQRGICDAVSGTNVHAGTIALTTDGFVITTAEDDTTARSWVWHAFGHPERLVAWIPKIARWMVGP